MAGAEKLIEKIKSDAKNEAEKLWREAEEKKAAMYETLMRDIGKRKAEIDKMAHDAALEKKRRMTAVYDLEYRKQLLAAKQEMMQKAKARALEKLAALDDAQYLKLMKEKLIGCAVTGEGSIAVSKSETRLGDAFLADVNKALEKKVGKGRIAFSAEKIDIRGGFVYIFGGMEINLSLEAQLSEAWHEAETEVAAVLFENCDN
ncbi:MAG: V-type ATP synthase subunit E [Eubacteriales bacterium]|nr:V-type ATP synthase subunit E [Eubacteriales bacterium]